jgi:hypothetical protein
MKVVILAANADVKLPDYVRGKLGPYQTSGSSLMYYGTINPDQLDTLRAAPGILSASEEEATGGAASLFG